MTDTTTFPSILAVSKFLNASGWKISTKTVQKHFNMSRFARNKDGVFDVAEITRYAKNHLPRKESGATTQETQDLSTARAIYETRRIAAQAQMWEMRVKAEKEKWMPREEFVREVTARAIIFKSDLENFARLEPERIIDLVGGDHEKAYELEEYLLDRFEIMLDRYAQPGEVRVILPDEATKAFAEEIVPQKKTTSADRSRVR